MLKRTSDAHHFAPPRQSAATELSARHIRFLAGRRRRVYRPRTPLRDLRDPRLVDGAGDQTLPCRQKRLVGFGDPAESSKRHPTEIQPGTVVLPPGEEPVGRAER